MKIGSLRPEFVECVPDHLEDGVLYISDRFRICSHKCCCGCGEEVVTPLSLAGWKLTHEGDLVSLWPSVGNWDYACRSHYWIQRNQVIESYPMTNRQVERVRRRDTADLARVVASNNAKKEARLVSDGAPPSALGPDRDAVTFLENRSRKWQALWRFLFGN